MSKLLEFCNQYWQEQTAKPRGIVKFQPAERVLDIYRRQRHVLVILDYGAKNPRSMVLSDEMFDSIHTPEL